MTEDCGGRFEKAVIGEGRASCDRCGNIVEQSSYFRIQIGPEHWQYIDVCNNCLNRTSRNEQK